MLHYADYLFLMLCTQVKIYVEGSIPTAVKQQTLCRLLVSDVVYSGEDIRRGFDSHRGQTTNIMQIIYFSKIST